MTLADLDRRMSRKLEAGKGIQLTAAELDLLVATGAYAKFREAVTESQRDQCRARSARSRSISAASSGSTRAQGDPSKSSGMTKSKSASEAHQRLRAILNKDA
jgi:hypothetical protein